MKVCLCIPVLNPGRHAAVLVGAITAQSLRPDSILVVDSASDDGQVRVFEELGARIHTIARAEFDHGGTRNLALQQMPADLYLFLTQDAVPVDPHSFARLVNALISRPDAGAAYGRQIPGKDADLFAAHHRLFNYPAEASFRTAGDIARYGIKAAFCSDSFAIYRRTALEEVGGFQSHLIWGEDTYAAARMLQLGWGIAYAPEAQVYHSHRYTMRQEFTRYFDVGVFHATQPWYLEFLGGVTREGLRLLKSQVRYLRANGMMFPATRAIIRNGIRWLAYRVGRHYSVLPRSVARVLSSNKAHWQTPGDRRAR